MWKPLGRLGIDELQEEALADRCLKRVVSTLASCDKLLDGLAPAAVSGMESPPARPEARSKRPYETSRTDAVTWHAPPLWRRR